MTSGRAEGDRAGLRGGLTVRCALSSAAARLRERGVDSPRLNAELLLAEALGVERLRLVLEPGRVLTGEELARFGGLLDRRLAREPLQYILGRQEFWSLQFPVDPRVLIPRPETELVVEAALEAARGLGPSPLVVDMGCGCGTISVVLARELPAARVLALDISPGAAACAREAARLHGVAERLMLAAADMFEPLAPGVRADVIVSNPPYIASGEIESLQPEVSRHEPRGALDGGPDGLEVIGRLLAEAPARLVGGGWLIFEAGAAQSEGIRARAARAGGWASHRVLRDLAGHPRVHVLRRR